jgi:hypothetical protein
VFHRVQLHYNYITTTLRVIRDLVFCALWVYGSSNTRFTNPVFRWGYVRYCSCSPGTSYCAYVRCWSVFLSILFITHLWFYSSGFNSCYLCQVTGYALVLLCCLLHVSGCPLRMVPCLRCVGVDFTSFSILWCWATVGYVCRPQNLEPSWYGISPEALVSCWWWHYRSIAIRVMRVARVMGNKLCLWYKLIYYIYIFMIIYNTTGT